MRRLGFTMLELIFVIVVMGIIGKFGVEFLAQAYNSYIYSKINNALQAKGEMAVEAVASRLQYRIKDSIIARDVIAPTPIPFQALAGSTLDRNATVLEWIGSDIEGFRGDMQPYWSGIIDLADSNATLLDSPETNTTALNSLIEALSHSSGTGINNAALYFIGSDTNINTDYGWDGNMTTINLQQGAIHPINAVGGQENKFQPKVGTATFSGIDIYEYYQLAWTAYAVEHNTTSNELKLYYDYQPWENESYTSGKSFLLMQNVDTFRFKAVGSVVKIQVCVYTDLAEDYSLCKEKTVF